MPAGRSRSLHPGSQLGVDEPDFLAMRDRDERLLGHHDHPLLAHHEQRSWCHESHGPATPISKRFHGKAQRTEKGRLRKEVPEGYHRH